ncbi:MAG: hypothetical protein ACREBW_05915, partial [Candidatus Micrarchaeaceae archaeon]
NELSIEKDPFKDVEIPKPHRRFEDRVDGRRGGHSRFRGHGGGDRGYSGGRGRSGGRFGGRDGGHRHGSGGGRGGFKSSQQRRGGYSPGQS